MTSNRNKAQSAMAISNAYKELLRIKQLAELQLRKIEELVKRENHPDFNSSDVLNMRFEDSNYQRREIATLQSKWHNIAYERGYFDTPDKPRKLSKVDQ